MHRQNPKRKARKIAKYEEDEDETAGILEYSPTVKAPTGTPRRRKKKGSLSLLAVEVLFEIFVYLQPLDVINIMYTSRAFRTLLIAPSSTFIWKAVRLNVDDFPDLPDDLSEFRYAKLAFDPHCYGCGKKTQNDPFWQIRARFCDACVQVELVQIIHCIDISLLGNVLGLIDHQVAKRGNNDPSRTLYFCKAHLKRLIARVGSIRHPNASAQAWLASEADRLKNIKEHASECRTWQIDVNCRREALTQQIKRQRKADIRQRLIDLGMGEALAEVPVNIFNNHRLVKPAVALTDRSWNNMKQPLLQWLHELDAWRLTRLVLTTYKRRNPEMILPNIHDFLALAEVQAVFDAPPDVPLSVHSFGNMWLLMENWRKNATLRIADLLVAPQKGNLSHRVDAALHDRRLRTLNLATTVFSCSMCLKLSPDTESSEFGHAEFMHYPWVMAHPCVQIGQSNREVAEWSGSKNIVALT